MSVAVKSKYKKFIFDISFVFFLFIATKNPTNSLGNKLHIIFPIYIHGWRMKIDIHYCALSLSPSFSYRRVDTCTHIFTALHRHSSVLLLMESGSEGMLHLPLAVISQGITYRHTCIHGSHLLTSMHLQITKDAGCMQSNVITSEDMLFTYKHTHIHTISFPPADTNIRQATKNWLPSHEIRLKEVYCHSLFKVNEVLISVRLCIHKPSVMNYTVVL